MNHDACEPLQSLQLSYSYMHVPFHPCQLLLQYSYPSVTSPYLFFSYIMCNPRNVKWAFTWSIVSDSSAMREASPPVAMTVAPAPISFFIRLTIPSTCETYP